MVQERSKAERLQDAVIKLFNERKDFIVIGLTGRTGSGCSTVARLLTQTFDQLGAPIPKDYITYDDRQYKHVYQYAKENWEPFVLISMKNVILTFVLEKDLDDLKQFIKDHYQVKDDTLKVLDKMKDQYDIMSQTQRKLLNTFGTEGQRTAKDYDEAYRHYFEDVPSFSKVFCSTLRELGNDLYTDLLQRIGTDIRSSGDPYRSDIDSEHIFRLSERTRQLIKILQYYQKGWTLVVIDAFRNPYEATYFKDRYSAFYLMSINTTHKKREERLLLKGMSIEGIHHMDSIEFPCHDVELPHDPKKVKEKFKEKDKDDGLEDFSSINIEKTIALSDVHLKNLSLCEVKRQLLRYVSLIMHPGLVTPTPIERCMQTAFNAKLNSGCLSRQVGAVVTDDDYMIKSMGWNNPPMGQVPCNLRDLLSMLRDNITDDIGLSEYERTHEDFKAYLKDSVARIPFKKLKGRVCSYCFKDAYNAFKKKKNQVHTRSIHAEEMAFLEISRIGGEGVRGGYLFSTASPCELCSKKAYHLGITKIYYIDQYPGISYQHILNSGERQVEMRLFHGAIGRAYNQFYTQIIPYKDELDMLIGLKFQPCNTPKPTVKSPCK